VSNWASLRPAVAAAVVLAVLAGAYEAALREPLLWPRPAIAPAATSLPGTVPGSEAAATGTAVATATVEKLTSAVPADTTIRFATYDPQTGDTLPHPRHEHRYVGTLSGRAIVLQLSAEATAAAGSWGSWYYRTGRQPHERRLLFQRQRGGQVVLLEDTPAKEPMDADTVAAEWHLGWPLGRVLTAQRRAVHGAGRQTVQLRQDYTQAVPYQLLRLTAHGNRCDALPGRSQPYYSAEFVRLLSADSLRLADWQTPPLAARRDSLRRWLLRESCQQTSESINVTLNDYGVLSYHVWQEAYYYGTHPEHSQTGFIVDLRTSREWLAEELLRPGTEPALLKLLARHLRLDYPHMSEGDYWDWKTVPPYPDSFSLTPTGLRAGYGDYALAGYASSTANTTTIPYPELRPLVRPGTPLARLLRARGL
jgi:hypothetical protein